MAITLSDLLALWQLALSAPPERRAQRCQRLIAQAKEASDYLQATGGIHPLLGDGSLYSLCARRELHALPATLTLAELGALAQVLGALHSGYEEAQDMHRAAEGSNRKRASAIASPQLSQ